MIFHYHLLILMPIIIFMTATTCRSQSNCSLRCIQVYLDCTPLLGTGTEPHGSPFWVETINQQHLSRSMYLSAKALVVREASPPVLTRWVADRLAILDRVPNPVVAKQLRLRCAVGEGVPGKASDTALVLTTCEYPLNLVLNAQPGS